MCTQTLHNKCFLRYQRAQKITLPHRHIWSSFFVIDDFIFTTLLLYIWKWKIITSAKINHFFTEDESRETYASCKLHIIGTENKYVLNQRY